MLGYETGQWQMKVYIGIPDPKNVIVLVVTGMLGGAFPRNMYTIGSYATSAFFFDWEPSFGMKPSGANCQMSELCEKKHCRKKNLHWFKKKEKNSQCLPTLVTFLPVFAPSGHWLPHSSAAVRRSWKVNPNHWIGDLQTNGFWDPMILMGNSQFFWPFIAGIPPLWQSTFRAWCPSHDAHLTPILWICFQKTWLVGPFWLQIRPTKK